MHYSPAEKVSILKKHLVDGVPVSTVCNEYQLQPTAFKNERRREEAQKSRIEAPEASPAS
jgi:transposase-like protein